MNLDTVDSQIHILLMNIEYLCLSLFCFPRKPAEVDEKFEDLNLGQGHMLTDWRSSFPNMGVWTGEQHLATNDWFEGRTPIDQ